MSSTSRGGQRSEADNYPTPSWCVRRFLERCPLSFAQLSGRLLEPCVGDGAICRAINQFDWLAVHGHPRGLLKPKWTMVDIRSECEAQVQDISGEFILGDFTNVDVHMHAMIGGEPGAARKFDVAITNPPFSLALPVLRACLAVSNVTVLLLRLNWLGSEERHPFLVANPPDLYILPNRPAFVRNAKGKWATDSIEYAWFVWGASAKVDLTERGAHYELLSLTPITERKH